MFCLNCGSADQSPNSYCRRCGTYLQDPSIWRRRDSPERGALWLAVVSVVAFLFSIAVMVLIFLISRRGGGRGYFVLSYGLCGGIAGYAVACFLYGVRLRGRFINARELSGGPGGGAGLKDADTAQLPARTVSAEATTALLNKETGGTRPAR